MQDFLKVIVEFLSTVGYFVSTGLYYFFIMISDLVKKVIDELAIPKLPSRSKLLNYTYISGTVFLIFLLYVGYINIKTYSLFVKDKENAVERKFRVSEARLLRNCFFGGALGGFLGMKKARHKTRKPAFFIGVTVMLGVQILLFSFVCGFFGFWIYMS